MNDKQYYVRGCTALLDALGCTIHHIGNVHKYARKEDVPAHTMFVITTDGMENASHIYSASDVKKMINEKCKHCKYLERGLDADYCPSCWCKLDNFKNVDTCERYKEEYTIKDYIIDMFPIFSFALFIFFY